MYEVKEVTEGKKESCSMASLQKCHKKSQNEQFTEPCDIEV